MANNPFNISLSCDLGDSGVPAIPHQQLNMHITYTVIYMYEWITRKNPHAISMHGNGEITDKKAHHP